LTQGSLGKGTQFAHPSRENATITDNWCILNAIKPAYNLRAHTAPLDILFNYNNNHFPSTYEYGAFITEHGSWNRPVAKGYRVQYLPISPTTKLPSGEAIPFLYYNNSASEVWPNNFRPVGLAFKSCNNVNNCLYVSSDSSSPGMQSIIVEISYVGPIDTTLPTTASTGTSGTGTSSSGTSSGTGTVTTIPTSTSDFYKMKVMFFIIGLVIALN